MKKKTLTSAVVAGVAGIAGIANISSAVNLNPDGVGQVLIYPFYTVNNGNDTLMSVVNTTPTVKAVKVRFLESKNSREVLDFNLYLSPFDVWVAAITSSGSDTDPALVIEPDDEDTCTVPDIPDGGQAFTNFLLSERFPPSPFGGNHTGDVYDNSLARTREGHIEVIEMGVLDEDADAQVTGLEAAAIHAQFDTSSTTAGVPVDCGALVNAWRLGGFWRGNDDSAANLLRRNVDVEAPTGGLFGGASIINVLGGYQVSYSADAIDGFYTVGIDGLGIDDLGPAFDMRSTLHFRPGDTFPALTQADTRALTGSSSSVRSRVFNDAAVVESDWTRPLPDAVSAVLMRDQLYNEYAVESSLGGATEWVVTFPTKRFYVVPEPVEVLADNPFTFEFTEDFIGACEAVSLNFWDREEDTTQFIDEVQFSPRPPQNIDTPVICFESQVITFGQSDAGVFAGGTPSAVLGSPNSVNVAVDAEGFESGWARIDFGEAFDLSGTNLAAPHFLESADPIGGGGVATDCNAIDSGDCYIGLPVTGFAVQVVRNNTLTDADGNNVLSNYAGLFQHRYDRDITGS